MFRSLLPKNRSKQSLFSSGMWGNSGLMHAPSASKNCFVRAAESSLTICASVARKHSYMCFTAYANSAIQESV